MTARHLLALAFFVALCSACPPPAGACQSDSDCAAGGVCEPICNCCIYPSQAADAGEDGGGGACEPACAAHEQCSGTTCDARYEAVRITAPATGPVQPGAMVTVRAELQLAAGRQHNLPQSLSLEVTDPSGATSAKEMPQVAGGYETAVQVGAAEGAYTLVARYPEANLASDEVLLTVDKTAPSFEVTLGTPPARPSPDAGTTWTDPETAFSTGAFRRDETLEVTVSSPDGDVDEAKVTVSVQFSQGMALQVPVNAVAASLCGGGAMYCGKSVVELWRPEMKLFRDTLSVTASGADLAGNSATSAAKTARVTRWKWQHEVDTNPIRASPAVASDGTVIVGSTNGSSVGRLTALRPDGTVKWTKSLGAVLASPAVGAMGGTGQTVYFAANSASGAVLYAVANDANGTLLHQCTPPSQGNAETALSVSRTQYGTEGQPVETASTVVNGAKAVLSIRPSGSAKCRDTYSGDDATFPAALVTKGADAYFGDTNGRVQGFTFGSGGWANKAGWPVSASLYPKGLAIIGSDLVGGGGPGQGGVFRLPEAGNVTMAPWQHKTATHAWNVSVGAGNVAWVGLNDGKLLRVTVGQSDAQEFTFGNGVVMGAPLLGQGGWLYLGRTSGEFSAVSAADPTTAAWTVANLGPFEGSANIDCARDASGTVKSGPGVVYAGATSGKLYAFIVDSKGIDVTAPWPRFQRDPRSSGNADGDLSAEFSCP